MQVPVCTQQPNFPLHNMSMVSIFTHLSILCGEHIDFGIYSRRSPQLLGCHPSAPACRRRAPAAVNSFPSVLYLPPVYGGPDLLVCGHLHTSTYSMSSVFTQARIPTHYTFGAQSNVLHDICRFNLCPYSADLPVHFHIWQSTHL